MTYHLRHPITGVRLNPQTGRSQDEELYELRNRRELMTRHKRRTIRQEYFLRGRVEGFVMGVLTVVDILLAVYIVTSIIQMP